MKLFIEGEDRNQSALFPEALGYRPETDLVTDFKLRKLNAAIQRKVIKTIEYYSTSESRRISGIHPHDGK